MRLLTRNNSNIRLLRCVWDAGRIASGVWSTQCPFGQAPTHFVFTSLDAAPGFIAAK